MMIERIRREHGYMTRLLAILRSKHHALKEEKSVSYSLMKEVVDYLSTHSEKIHHPKEDLIYRHFVDNYGNSNHIANLEDEHKQLAENTHQFLEMIDMILNDAIIPQEILIENLEQFIITQKQHLDLEEQEILPLIDKTFTVEDWQAVDSLWDVDEEDPVFGETIADRYKQLAQRVRLSKDDESV